MDRGGLLARVGRVQTSSNTLLSARLPASTGSPLRAAVQHEEEEEEEEELADVALPTAPAPAPALTPPPSSPTPPPPPAAAATDSDGIAVAAAAAAKPAAREWTARERRRVVAAASFAAFLHPLSTSVYTPILSVIKEDLQCSDAELMITISAYLGVLGVMPLVWGPVSDVYGRRRTILLSTIVFCATSIACGFAWNIGSLIAMRVLQAFGSSACLTVGAGAIADTHPPAKRGVAMGIYLLGPLVGPVLGPTIGGIMTQYLGWRSIFYVLGGMAVLVMICVFFFLPETLAPLPPGTKKPFPNPLAAFKNFRYHGVAMSALTASWAYGCFYSMVVVMPSIYTKTFGLEPQIVGAIMIPSGLGTMFGSVLGGVVADRVSRNGRPVSYRLIPTGLGQLAFVPGVILLGWFLQSHLAVAVVLYTYSSFFFTFPRPGLTTYSVEIASQKSGKQVAGAINGLLYSCMYLTGGISAQVQATLIPMMGYGWYFTAITLPVVPMSLGVMWIMWRGIREHWRTTHGHMPLQDHEDGEQHAEIQLEELGATVKRRDEPGASVDIGVDVDDEEEHGGGGIGRNNAGTSADKARLL